MKLLRRAGMDASPRVGDRRPSLYESLAEPITSETSLGETNLTRQKETLDNDAESHALEELALLDAGSDIADVPAARRPRGETLLTKQKETLDNDAEMLVIEEMTTLVD